MATIKYFSGTQAVKNVFPLPNRKFVSIGGVLSRGNRYDGFQRLCGHPVEGPDAWLPVTRMIEYKSNPSLHKCDARCRHAKGHSCECSCGGEFHGSDS